MTVLVLFALWAVLGTAFVVFTYAEHLRYDRRWRSEDVEPLELSEVEGPWTLWV